MLRQLDGERPVVDGAIERLHARATASRWCKDGQVGCEEVPDGLDGQDVGHVTLKIPYRRVQIVDAREGRQMLLKKPDCPGHAYLVRPVLSVPLHLAHARAAPTCTAQPRRPSPVCVACVATAGLCADGRDLRREHKRFPRVLVLHDDVG